MGWSRPIIVDGVQVGIACGRGRRGPACSAPDCNEEQAALCDWPLTGRKEGQTCDRSLCEKHRHRHGKKDYCEAHETLRKQTAAALTMTYPRFKTPTKKV